MKVLEKLNNAKTEEKEVTLTLEEVAVVLQYIDAKQNTLNHLRADRNKWKNAFNHVATKMHFTIKEALSGDYSQ